VKKPTTGEELLAELARDPDYVRRKARQEAQHKRHWERVSRDEEPIVADLIAAGAPRMQSLWDLVERKAPLTEASARVLLDHLGRGHRPWTKETIARALAFAPAAMADDVTAAFRRERDVFARPMLALAVTEMAIRGGDVERGAAVVSDLLSDATDGDTRSVVDGGLRRGGPAGRAIAKAVTLEADWPTPVERELLDAASRASQRPGVPSSSTSIGLDVEAAGRLMGMIAALPGYESIETLDIPDLSNRLATEEALTLTWQVRGDVVEIELFKDDVDAIDITITGSSEHIDPIDEVLAAFIE
jgi:hypothetical protein